MIGSLVGNRYELLRELGRGGMGVVYLANDPMLDREVAIKLIPPSHLDGQNLDRFRREARTLAKMDHPSIVVVYDTGEHDGSMYYVMPVVRGVTLRQFLKERSYQMSDVFEIAIAVAEALDYSHSMGVVHRDIKPENILIARDGTGAIRVRVTDFGLAIDTAVDRLTQSGSLVGTVSYLSPEQISRGTLDGRADLYSLATVLYECFAGDTPFSGPMANSLYRIVHERPLSLRERGIDIDPELETLILQCLEKDPARRPGTGRMIASVVRRCATRLPDHLSRPALPNTSVREDSQTARIDPLALSEIVGRGEEVGELLRRLDRTMLGECQFVVIGGDAGIGKTCLLEELHRLARLRRIRVLTGRFVEHDRGFPFQGFCDLVIDCFRSRASSDSTALPDLSDLLPDLVALFPVLGEVERLRSASSAQIGEPERRPRGDDRTHIFELLARTLTRIGGERPLVILLEDLHVAEVSLDALQYIVSRLGPTPTLVVGTYRASSVDKRHPIVKMISAFQGDRRFSSMHLQPLSREEHRQFVERSLNGSIADPLAARLFEASEGNPYFTRELIRSLIDGQAIRRSGDHWSMVEDEERSDEWLPATIQQAIERRVETLGDEQRHLLSVAAVIGRGFELRELHWLDDKDDLEDLLDGLIASGFIQEERESRGDRFTFSSGVVRDVLYNALPRRRRKALHQRFAETLEAKHTGRLPRVYPQLLHHYAQADIQEKVIDFGLRLAQKSLEAFSPDEVLRSGRLVLEFLEEDNPAHVPLHGEARILVARAHRMKGNIDAALRELTEAVRLFERESEAKRLLDALVLAAETAWEGRRTDETRRWLDSACRLARAAGANDILGRLLPLSATVANLRGDHELAAQLLAEAETLRAAHRGEDAAPRGGTLRVALVAQVQTRDPIDVTFAEEEELLSNVFETLVARGEKGNLVPSLAEQWEVQEQGRVFTLTLRTGVKLHDGRTLDASLVKSALDRALRHTAAASTPALAAIAKGGVEVCGPNELRITLREPIPIFPSMLTHERTAIALPSESGELVGTGRFRIAAFAPGQIVLERNDEYRSTPAYVDRIQFTTTASAAEAAEQFRAGAVDLARDLLPQDLEDILRNRVRRATVVECPKSDVYFLILNRFGRLADHPGIRAALFRSVRLEDLVWRTLGRFAEPADGFIPPTILGRGALRRRLFPQEVTSAEAAAETIVSSGFALPLRLRAAVHPVLRDRYGSLTRMLFETWRALGVEVEIVTPDMSSYLEHLGGNPSIDLMLGRFVADYDDADNFVFGLLHSERGLFRHYFASPEVDRLAEEARSENSPAAREKLYRRVETLLAESDFLLPLFHDIDYRVASPLLRGLELSPIPPYVNYAGISKIDAHPEARRSMASVTIPLAGNVQTLDPTETFLVAQSEVMPTIYETLTRQNESAQIVPCLATEIIPEDGARRFRFRLRDGIRFHDGRRLTARDVRYSFEHSLRNEKSKRRGLFAPIRGARALTSGEASDLAGFTILSSLDFTIDLEQPMSFFPALLAFEAAGIVPEGMTDFSRTAIGTGPFRVVRFEPDHRLELEANPYYWRKGLPRIDRLTFVFGISPPEIARGFEDGRYAMAWDLLPSDIERLRTDPHLGANYADTPLLSTAFIAFNANRGPFADPLLRQSIASSLDNETLVRRHIGRLGIPAHGMIPPGLLGHESRGRERARIPSTSSPLELTCLVNSAFEGPYASFFDGVSETLARRRISLHTISSGRERAAYFEALENGSCDLIITRWVADYPDADTFMHDVLQSRSGFMGRLCGSPRLDALIERGRTEPNPARRHVAYREVESILHDETLVVPLFHEQAYRFTRPEIENIDLHFGAPAVRYEELSLARGAV